MKYLGKNRKYLTFFMLMTTIFVLFSSGFVHAETRKGWTRNKRGGLGRNEIAKEHMSIVAEEVEQILNSDVPSGEVGKTIRKIAKNQKEAQKDISENLNEIGKRKGWVKKILGTNKKAIKNMEGLINKNQLRIQQMSKFKNQVQNTAQKDQVQKVMQAMVEQNTILQEQIQVEKNIPTIFDGLFKILTSY